MGCCIAELRNKDVICKSNGCRLGNVDDVEIDVTCGKLVCIVIYSRGRLFGRSSDLRIPWEKIEIIGEEVILVDYCLPDLPPPLPKKRFF